MPRTIAEIDAEISALHLSVDAVYKDETLPVATRLSKMKQLNIELEALSEEKGNLPLSGSDPNNWAPGRKALAESTFADVAGQAFAKSVIDAGFSRSKGVTIPSKMLGLKASTLPSAETWAPRVEPGIIALGRDERFIVGRMPIIDLGIATAIDDWKQTVRTLTGTVKRAIDATATKATVDVTVVQAVEEAAQFAVTIDDIPNAVFESKPAFGDFLADEGRFQVMKALDDHIIAQIVAATPDQADTGTGLIEQARHAVGAMRANGARPTLLVLDPADAVTLDLFQVETDTPLFATRSTGSASPLWGLTIIEAIGRDGAVPLLIDPAMLGVLYLGDLKIEADPFSGFKENLTTLRVEFKGLFHVRNVQGAYLIDVAV